MASQYDLPYTGNQVETLLGKVSDLEDEMPHKTSDLVNDSGFITQANVPTNVSQLTNDSGFITNAPVTAEQSRAQAAESALGDRIDAIGAKIPSEASSSNQLADKNFVNSSIGTSTANYISYNGGPFPSVADLNAYSGPHDKNDYAYVISTDSAGNTIYSRYKFNGTSWVKEYDLNNSSFTSAQWATINSGMISADKTKIDGISAGAQVNVIETIKVNGTAISPTDKAVNVEVPTTLASLAEDTTHRVVTDTEKTTWSGKYTKPSGGIPASDIADGVIPDVSGKVNTSDIADNLTTNDATKVLSAKQGKVLNDNLTQLGQKVISGGTAMSRSGYGAYISTSGIITETTDTDKEVMLYSIPKGTYKVVIPKCGNAYNSYYGLSISKKPITGSLDTYVGPSDGSTNKEFTIENADYNYLYICYVVSSGTPIVTLLGIDGEKIAPSSIPAGKLANDSVSTNNLIDKSVTISKLNTDIFYRGGNPDYSDTIKELYLSVPIPSGYDVVVKYYSNELYIRPASGTTVDSWQAKLGVSTAENGTIYPIVCTTAGNGVVAGAIVGYVIFKDITLFKSKSTTAVGVKVYKDYISDAFNSPTIYQSYGLDLGAQVTVGKTINNKYLNRVSQAFVDLDGRAVAIFPITPKRYYRIHVPKTGSSYSALYGLLTSIDQTSNITISQQTGTSAAIEFVYYHTDASYKYIAISYSKNEGVPTCTDVSSLQSVVDQIDKDVKHLEGIISTDIDINVPDVVTAIVGDKLQLYYESIFKVVNPFNYDIKVSCNIGAQYPRYYEVTPNQAQVGSYPLKFLIKNYSGTSLGEKTCTLNVVESEEDPVINILCVGASTTVNGEWVGETKRRLTTSAGTPTQSQGGSTLFTPTGFNLQNINFVGRKEVGGAKFEATGGYNYNSYNSATAYIAHFYFSQENLPNVSLGDVYSDGTNQFTVTEKNIPTTGTYAGNIGCSCSNKPHSAALQLAKVSGSGDANITASLFSFTDNPFMYNGSVDVAQYAEDYCGGQIDVVLAYLFANGMIQPYQEDFSVALTSMRTFINNIMADFPSCKFGIMLSPNKDARGGLGVDYGAAESNIWTYEYGMKVANHNLLTALQNYIEEEELTNVFIVNILNEFDYMNDYQQTNKQVNPRSGVMEVFGVNGVHPSIVGYYQIADSATRAIIGIINQ